MSSSPITSSRINSFKQSRNVRVDLRGLEDSSDPVFWIGASAVNGLTQTKGHQKKIMVKLEFNSTKTS